MGEKIEISFICLFFFASYVEVKGFNQRHKVSSRKNKKIIFNLIGCKLPFLSISSLFNEATGGLCFYNLHLML